MTAAGHPEDLSLGDFNLSLLRGGPLYRLLVRAGIARPGRAGNVLRILFFVGLTWIPLAAITIVQGSFLNASIRVPFLYDFAEACRFLFMLPLLILAEDIVEPWLRRVIAHFCRLVSEADTEKFNNYIAIATRSRDSLPAELLLLLLAFIRPHIGDLTFSSDITSWRTVTTNAGSLPTAAYLYYLYVAKPIVAFIWFRWLWKYIIWSRLLVRISTLSLRVTPTHPDRMGGLGFIGVGQVLFSILYFAFAAQVASYVGEAIAFEGATLMSFKYLIMAVVALAPVVFLTPCLAFTPKLLDCKRRGLLEYGALADQYTKDFHEKWIKGVRGDDETLLGTNDIQSLADMANSFEVVRSMQPVIINKGTVVAFLVAALLPFVPLLMTVYPFDELLTRLWKILL